MPTQSLRIAFDADHQSNYLYNGSLSAKVSAPDCSLLTDLFTVPRYSHAFPPLSFVEHLLTMCDYLFRMRGCKIEFDPFSNSTRGVISMKYLTMAKYTIRLGVTSANQRVREVTTIQVNLVSASKSESSSPPPPSSIPAKVKASIEFGNMTYMAVANSTLDVASTFKQTLADTLFVDAQTVDIVTVTDSRLGFEVRLPSRSAAIHVADKIGTITAVNTTTSQLEVNLQNVGFNFQSLSLVSVQVELVSRHRRNEASHTENLGERRDAILNGGDKALQHVCMRATVGEF